MSITKQLEIQFEDQNPQKWCHPLKEEAFLSFMSKGNSAVHKVFGEGSLFSPFLFGKFFDPSDAFPLWEFDSDVFLSNLNATSQHNVDWSETDTDYVLKADLPGNDSIQVCVENGKVLEISGQWRQPKESKMKDWRSRHWWEYGFVRRLELPENSDWRNLEASLKNNTLLEIKIPKSPLDSDHSA